MRVWIDLSNSPHPLLFAPVAESLAARGHEVLFTARDNAQTVELARQRWPSTEVIGDESPAGRAAKGVGIASRIGKLRGWARHAEPDVALSHNSYAQIVAARTLGISVVTAMDYEHQPANHLAFRLARAVLVPAAYPDEAARRQGAGPKKLIRYPGLKESLYLGDFEPDAHAAESVGVASGKEPLVVARPPPSRAIYHRLDNPLFQDCLRTLDARGARLVVLPRHPEQRAGIEALDLRSAVMPPNAVDSRSLMVAADLFLGAGGTMTREAALLGTRAFTVFAGEVPAVDRWLEREGLVERIERSDALPQLSETVGPKPSKAELQAASEPILECFLEAVEGAATSG